MPQHGESVLLTDNDTKRSGKPWTQRELVEMFASDDVFATTLLVFCIDRFTTQCLDWTTSTLTHELQLDFGISLPSENVDKLQAAMQIVQTDDYWQRLPMFCALTEALCGNGLQFDTVSIPNALECAWGITEAMLLSPPDDDQRDVFVPEISSYVASRCREEFILHPPRVLQIVGGIEPDYSGVLATGTGEAEAMLGTSDTASDDMEQTIKEAYAALRNQLAALPLQNGRVDF
jgi:hypothetical protein